MCFTVTEVWIRVHKLLMVLFIKNMVGYFFYNQLIFLEFLVRHLWPLSKNAFIRMWERTCVGHLVFTICLLVITK